MSIIFQSGMRMTPARLAHIPRGILARGRRTSNSSASTTTEIPVLRVDDVPILSGRAYRITVSNIAVDVGASGAGAIPNVKIRHTTDGSTPTITSAEIAYWRHTLDNATAGPVAPLVQDYYPASDETWSLLLTVQRFSGSDDVVILGNSTSLPINMVIEDLGIDPTDTGVDL